MEAKPKITIGYPEEEYIFTGVWSVQEQGGYNTARRNRRKVKYPIYRNKEGKTLCDASQIVVIKRK